MYINYCEGKSAHGGGYIISITGTLPNIIMHGKISSIFALMTTIIIEI